MLEDLMDKEAAEKALFEFKRDGGMSLEDFKQELFVIDERTGLRANLGMIGFPSIQRFGRIQ